MLNENADERPTSRFIIDQCNRYSLKFQMSKQVDNAVDNLVYLRSFVSGCGLVPEENIVQQVSLILSGQDFNQRRAADDS